ncbi:hypothetical protein [Rhodococcus opacus]|uniref:Uncharacterized protein n=1 Tax=Rhodococcus opacus TaxID=37919 RepID=A0A076ESN7_RHOOP|nr:hypothetical protein [Rhodococcus opacus]AII08272.1 hypothetical protein EP51_28070 [Rhodococcus opacus]
MYLSKVSAWATAFMDRTHAERRVRFRSRPGIGSSQVQAHIPSPETGCSTVQLSSLVGAMTAMLAAGFSAHAEYQSLLLGDYE